MRQCKRPPRQIEPSCILISTTPPGPQSPGTLPAGAQGEGASYSEPHPRHSMGRTTGYARVLRAVALLRRRDS
eukprot:1077898-Pyramimonas_sp.AAC.1